MQIFHYKLQLSCSPKELCVPRTLGVRATPAPSAEVILGHLHQCSLVRVLQLPSNSAAVFLRPSEEGRREGGREAQSGPLSASPCLRGMLWTGPVSCSSGWGYKVQIWQLGLRVSQVFSNGQWLGEISISTTNTLKYRGICAEL